MAKDDKPYTVDEVVGLLCMWGGELAEIGAGLTGSMPLKIYEYKAKRVAREINELITNTEGFKNVKGV